MLYEKYEAKVKRSIARRKFLLKYKYLLIALGTILILSISAFFYMKGNITGSVIVSNAKYGEAIKVNDSINAFMSGHYIEYKASNSDNWTEVEPTLAGTYQVRAVSNGIFGKRYSKVEEFTINKIKTEVTISDSISYNGTPDVKFKLVGEDYAVEDSYTFNITSIDGVVASGYVDTTNLKIKNKNNDDVTNSYEFDDKYEFKANIDTKVLNLSLEDIKDYNYNNSIFDKRLIKVNGVVNGLNITYDYKLLDSNGNEVNNQVLNVGSYRLVLSNLKIFDGTLDVTNKFVFDESILQDTFTVNRIALTIKTKNIEKTYDGIELNPLDYDLEGMLINTHKIEVISSVKATNVGYYTNEMRVKIVDQNGKDVTDIYNISYMFGTINITPIQLNISLLPISNKEYDGKRVSYSQEDMNFTITNGKLLPGDSFKVQVGYRLYDLETDFMKDAGSYSVYPRSFVFSSGNRDNYKINCEPITFEITKVNLTLQFNKEIVVYDGLEHHYSKKFTITSGKLVDGELLEVKIGGNSKINVGNYAFENYNFLINGYDNKNYTIDHNNAVLEITKLKVEVYVYDHVEQYNGTGYSNSFTLNYKILNEHKPFISIKYNILKDGVVLNSVLDAGTYDLELLPVVLDNYEIIFTNTPKLIIEKYNISIKPTYKEKMYDGNPLDNFTFTIDDKDGNLPIFADDYIVDVVYECYLKGVLTNPIDANTYDIKIKSFNFKGTNPSNYNVTINQGEIVIKPRDIVIGLNSDSKDYDGMPYIYNNQPNNYTFDSNSLRFVGDDQIIVEVSYLDSYHVTLDKPVNSGMYTIGLKNINYLGNTKASNYNITTHDATLAINKAKLSIRLQSMNGKEYDGNPLVYTIVDNNYEIISGTLYGNDSFKVNPKFYLNGTLVSYPVNAGIYDLTVNSNDQITFTNGNADNYDITVDSVKVEIKARHIIIAPYDVVVDYTNTEYYYNPAGDKYKIISGTLLPGHTFDVEVIYKNNLDLEVKAINAGSYKIVINKIVNNNFVYENYEFEMQSALLTINKGNINVNISDTVQNYKGTYFTYNDIKYQLTGEIHGTVALNLQFIDSDGIASDKARNAGTYRVVLYGVTVNDYYYNDITENYNITFNNTVSFTVNRAKLTVIFGEMSKMYDGTPYTLNNDPIVSGLLGDDTITTFKVTYYDSFNNEIIPVNAGDYSAKINDIKFANTIVNNYDCEYVKGTLHILKRLVVVNVDSLESVYNGNYYSSQSNLTYKVDQSSNDFLPGDSIVLNGQKYTDNNALTVNPKNAGKYNVTYSNIIYHLNENNYQVIVNPGILTIKPKHITVNLLPVDSYVYDGLIREYKNVEQTNIVGLVDNIQIFATLTFKNLTYNTIHEKLDSKGDYQVLDYTFTSPNKELLDNYQLVVDNLFKFTVTPRKISISTNDYIVDYQGQANPHVFSNYNSVDINELLSSDKIEVKKEFSATNVGVYENVIELCIFNTNYQTIDKKPVDVTKLYEINYTYGNVTINKIDLHIDYNTETVIKNYDKLDTNLKYTVNGALDEFNINFNYYDYDTNRLVNSLTNVGHYKASIELNQNDFRLKNYNIIINNNSPTVYKEIIVNKANLVINTKSKTFDYLPNVEQKCQEYNALGLLPGDEIVVLDSATIMLPGTVKNDLTLRIMCYGNDITQNYDITYNYGTLTINNDLFVRNVEKLKIYDGKTYGNSHKLTVQLYNKNNQMINDIEVIIYFKPDLVIKDAGLYKNAVDRIEINYTGADYKAEVAAQYVKSYNFDLSTIICEIEKRTITMKPQNVSKVYDGTPLNDYSDNYILLDSTTNPGAGLVLGHHVSVYTELSTKFNEAKVFANVYKIISATIYDEFSNDVTHNYNVIASNDNDRTFLGRARITPRVVYLETGSATFNFDYNEPLKFYYCNEVSVLTQYDDESTGLLSYHHYDINMNSFGVSRVGTHRNRARIRIYDPSGTEVTNNYRFSYRYSTGYITII